MAVTRRQDGEGVPRPSHVRRRPGSANAPVRARASRPVPPPEDVEQMDSQTEAETKTSSVRSRGTARLPGSGTSAAKLVRSTPVEQDTDEDEAEAEDAEPTFELEEEDWEPDALDDQVQEELAEEFGRIATGTPPGPGTPPGAPPRTTRRSRAAAETRGSSGTGRMPASGVVPPVAGRQQGKTGALDGMHTMDGQAAVPIDDLSGRSGIESDTDEDLPPAQARYRRNMDPSQIYRGRSRLALIRDLAMGEWTDQSIAQSIGVPYDVIVDFRLTYETEINEVRLSLANQLAIESAGMWISKRQNRIAEMQEDYEDIDLVLAVMRENTKTLLHNGIDGSDSQIKGDAFDTNLLLGSRRHQNLLRSKLAIMKAVSDELSPRNKDDSEKDESSSIRYVIEQDGPGDDILSSLT